MKLSAVVLTKDEERNITACLDTLGWVDELIVLDSFSQDATISIAQAKGARVHQKPFLDFPTQRNAAMGFASGDWLLFIDADERVPRELAAEIRQKIMSEEISGWWIPRKNYIFGKLIRHAGWYPDFQLRLFRRGRARYDEGREVHEVVILEGQAGYLENPLIHLNYDNIAQFLSRQCFYAELEARMMYRQGMRTRWRNFLLQPLREFKRRYITSEGYRDGLYGLLLSILMAYYNFLVYVRLRELDRA